MYKEKRIQLPARLTNKLDDLLLIQFQQLPIDIPAMLMVYAPIEKFNEFNPQLIIDYCNFKNPHLQLAYPLMKRIAGTDVIEPVLVTPNTQFTCNKYDVYEPVNAALVVPNCIDMVLVPLLCFDAAGYRVGYGKGYYDRFLQQCPENCIKIGFSYFDAVDSIDDINEFDRKLDYCITPETVYTF